MSRKPRPYQFRQEVITPVKVIGAMLVFSGVAFNLLARPYLQIYSPLQATAWFMACGWLAMFTVTLATGTLEFRMPSADTWWVLLFIGTLGGAVPIFLFNWALGHIEATLVSVCLGLNPLTAAVLGVVVLSEPLTLSLVLGLLLVLAGIVIANYRTKKVYEHFD
ncbi:MAG: DMT family transporter [Pseudomonadales bacterium]|nr:DMT family transporter [Pseudomonadales bacterium]